MLGQEAWRTLWSGHCCVIRFPTTHKSAKQGNETTAPVNIYGVGKKPLE